MILLMLSLADSGLPSNYWVALGISSGVAAWRDRLFWVLSARFFGVFLGLVFKLLAPAFGIACHVGCSFAHSLSADNRRHGETEI